MVYAKRRNYRRRASRKVSPFKRVKSRALVAKAKTRRLVKLIKGVTLKQSETKYKTESFSIINQFHDVLGGVSIWNAGSYSIFPTQGVQDDQRIGDNILTQGIMMRAIFQIPADRRNTMFKLWYVPTNEQSSGSPFTYSTFFHNISGNGMLDPIQKDRFPNARYLGKFMNRSNDQQPDEDKTIFVKRWLPMKKNIKFYADAASPPVNIPTHGHIVMLPYDSISTLITDIVITRAQFTFTLYYKDP